MPPMVRICTASPAEMPRMVRICMASPAEMPRMVRICIATSSCSRGRLFEGTGFEACCSSCLLRYGCGTAASWRLQGCGRQGRPACVMCNSPHVRALISASTENVHALPTPTTLVAHATH
eukprot:11884-Chlamydomonas_euryale.AAC.1